MQTLLLADADPLSAEVVRTTAGRVGLRVVTAENGIEALERYRAEDPRYVVVDRLLPILDGLQVAHKVRETPAGRATVVILTGAMLGGLPRERRDPLQLSDVLDKPFGPDDLMRALAPFLAGPDEPVGPAEPPAPGGGERVDLSRHPMALALLEIASRRLSGELVWRRGGLVKSLHFADGDAVAATSNGRRDHWPCWAARDPLLPPEVRARLAALAFPGPASEGWGEYLEARGAFPQPAFAASRMRWLLDLAREFAALEDGVIEFVEGARAAQAIGRVDGPTLAWWALRRARGDRFAALLPRPLAFLRRGPHAANADLPLNQIEQQLLQLADGAHTTGDLLSLGQLIQQDVAARLHGALVFGLVEPVAATADGSAAEMAPVPPASAPPPGEGELAGTGLARVVAATSSLGRTGILQLRRGGTVRWLHFEVGRLVFARSNHPSHRLGEVLLSGGRISAEDHARALAIQAGERDRRLGAVLLGIGALTLKELEEGLADQVRTILADAFAWPDGSYVFLEGELPTTDAVSLDSSMPNLILALARGTAPGAALPPETVVATAWPADVTRRLLRLEPAEARLLAAAGSGRRLSDLMPAAPGPEFPRALTALLACGALVVGTSAAAHSEPQAARDAGAEPAAVPSPEAAQLRSALCALERRVLELEAENRRLRALLSTGATVCA